METGGELCDAKNIKRSSTLYVLISVLMSITIAATQAPPGHIAPVSLDSPHSFAGPFWFLTSFSYLTILTGYYHHFACAGIFTNIMLRKTTISGCLDVVYNVP